MFLLVEHSAGQ